MRVINMINAYEHMKCADVILFDRGALRLSLVGYDLSTTSQALKLRDLHRRLPDATLSISEATPQCSV